MNRYYIHLSTLMLMIALLSACINPINDFEQVAYKRFLTVEASITDQVGAQKVKLYQSADKIDGSGNFVAITGAKVYVTTASGQTEDFVEQTSSAAKGVYASSDGFLGKIGETYTLHIKLSNGKEYESTAETMRKAPEIENVITQFEINDAYSKGDARRVGFNVYADFQDDPALGDYYQWFWKHYERAPFCITCVNGAKYNFSTSNCESPRIPNNDVWNYLCSSPCWNTTFSTELNLMSDAYLNGKRITGKKVARVPFSDYTPYYLQLEQRSLTRNSYNYYLSLANQTQNTGTLFDVPAETRFSLNIKNKADVNEKILGIFDVYAVKKRIFYIDRQAGVPDNEYPLKTVVDGNVYSCPPGSVNCQDKVPCLEGLYRTPFRPEGWIGD